ncbi:MAG: hypothetical protein NTX97_08835 [Bacteroidetes bacterium]|nr:hypothetical protein [Bacteroidota bacterium]
MHLNSISKTFILFFILQLTKGAAQDTLNSASVEQKSYQLYLDKNWPELIKYGNTAVKNGVDYFYLEMRIGIAYYERKNYCLAEGYFKKALKYNSNDASAQEYLYYCYIFTGRFEAARMFSKQFGEELAKKTGTNTLSKIGFVMVEGGSKKTDSTSYYDRVKKTNTNYFDNATYYQFGINHYIKNSTSVFHALTYFKQKSFLGTNRQLQYYLKFSIPLKKDWLISPAIQLINTKNSNTLTSPSNAMPPSGMRPPPKSGTVVSRSNSFVGSLEIQKNIKKISLSVGTTVSNMDSTIQFNHNGTLAYSILGNSRLIIGCRAYIHTSNSYSTTYTSYSPYIYIQPSKRISITTSYLSNVGNNIIEENGYLVNNSPDLTTSRWSALASLNVNKHISLYGLYQMENKKESVQLFNYNYHVIVVGLKFVP